MIWNLWLLPQPSRLGGMPTKLALEIVTCDFGHKY